MSFTLKLLITAKLAENSQVTQYTATNCKARIDKFTVTNQSASNATLSVNLVASGGSPASSNLILKEKAIAPSETHTCPELSGHVLESGWFISTIASAASALTIACSGIEIT